MGGDSLALKPGRARRRPAYRAPDLAGDDRPHAGLLRLQRLAGNQAVTQVIAQRDLSVTAAAFEASMGTSNTRSFLGTGASSFAQLRKAVQAYEAAIKNTRPEAEQTVVMALALIDRRATAYLNLHRDATKPQDVARRALVVKLQDEIPAERAKLSQKQAQDRYMESLTAGQSLGTFKGGDSPHKFQAAQGGRSIGASAATNYEGDIFVAGALADDQAAAEKQARAELGPRQEFFKKHGVTAAESAALRIYTTPSDQYRYMNAAAANSKGWMRGVKAGANSPDVAKTKKKVLMEEGSLHTAMANRGLLKIPAFKGRTYRGDAMDAGRFGGLAVGSYTFSHLVSTSTKTDTAFTFLGSNLSASNAHGVVWAFEDAGGRRVGRISETQGEGEVLLPVNTVVQITDIIPANAADAVTRAGKYAAIAKRLKGMQAKRTDGTMLYLVVTVAVPQAAAGPATAPAAGPVGAAATG